MKMALPSAKLLIDFVTKISVKTATSESPQMVSLIVQLLRKKIIIRPLCLN